jgi:exocyst complex component 4
MTYYDKCHGWYKALVSRGKPHPTSGKLVKMSASLVEDESEFKATLNKLASLGESDSEEVRRGVLDEETQLLLKIAQSVKIEEQDILMDRRSITQLCLLHTSMKWLALRTASLRLISTEAIDSTRRESRQGANRRWTQIATYHNLNTDSDKVFLPLNEETAEQFDAAVGLYRGLAQTAVRTLHVEVRCHALHWIEKAMRQTFVLEQEVREPDAAVVGLNADLVSVDEVLGGHLMEAQRR